MPRSHSLVLRRIAMYLKCLRVPTIPQTSCPFGIEGSNPSRGVLFISKPQHFNTKTLNSLMKYKKFNYEKIFVISLAIFLIIVFIYTMIQISTSTNCNSDSSNCTSTDQNKEEIKEIIFEINQDQTIISGTNTT